MKNTMDKLIEKIKVSLEKLSNMIQEDYIDESSAQCAYYTILSFIPFTILLITLIQYTNINQQTLFDVISKFIPASMNEVILGIVKEVYSKSIGTISISIIFTLWSAGKGLFVLIKSFNKIYNIKDRKSNSYLYLKLMSLIKTIVFLLLIILGLIVLVFGNSLFSAFGNIEVFSNIITVIAFIIITTIVFLLIYKFMPKHKVSFKSQLPGAVFGGVSLNVISYVFSKYLVIFKGFSITYGSLTTLMLVMMWVHACFYILFLGSEINKVFLKCNR